MGYALVKGANSLGISKKFKVLMELLAIPLRQQAAKWLVISKTRREQKITTQHMFDM
jgi:hypothetical protein